MKALQQKVEETIANAKWKVLKRLRGLLRRNQKYLEAGLREASGLISARTGRTDWPKVSLVIDWKDMMYEGYPTHYFSSGYSALFCVRRALDEAGKKSPGSILDFGCGHGRVLRTLAADFPHAGLTVTDLNAGGVNFCARAFGAIPVYSSTDRSRVSFHRKFDLIWVGSVFTHLRPARWLSLWELFRSVLTEDGLLVFSTHGGEVARRLREGRYGWYGLEAERAAEILQGYDKSGFGYSDYRKSRDYGVSVSSPEWVGRQIVEVGLEPVLCQKNGWDDCQDVWAARK